MRQTAYTRAVEMFEAFVTAPEQTAHATPASLIQSAGASASTGYRHVAALEAEGLLRRDTTGTYLTGLVAIRTGLKGYGLGRIAPLVQPILMQLRQATQHTAYLAVVQDMDLQMGPHSLGRETRGIRLRREYSFETIPDMEIGKTTQVGLLTRNSDIARRVSTLMVPVYSSISSIVVIGLIVNSARDISQDLTTSLYQACTQIRSAGEMPDHD